MGNLNCHANVELQLECNASVAVNTPHGCVSTQCSEGTHVHKDVSYYQSSHVLKDVSYYQAKQSASEYQRAKELLLGKGRIFDKWVRAPCELDDFVFV